MGKILIKRGLEAAVSKLALETGEFALAKDTGNVYIGVDSGKVHLNPTGGTADEAVKLKTPRQFSASGDAIAEAVAFDGTRDVALVLQLANMSGLTAGTYTKLTVDAKGRVTGGTAITVADLPSIPRTKVTGLGTAAALDTGTTAGKVVLVGADGKIDNALIPSLAITDVHEAANETAMLALDAQIGDICIRSDENKSYILAVAPATTKANWKWLKTPDCKMLSVNGKTGAVTLTAADVGAVPTTRKVNNKALNDDISLSASDVGAAPTSHTSAVASASAAGHVKVGAGLAISNGVLSVGDIDGGTF